MRCQAAGQPLPWGTACLRWVSRQAWGWSSPVRSTSARERETNGLIRAKARLQLHHSLFSSFFSIFHTAPDKNECNSVIKIFLYIIRRGQCGLPRYLHF